jgi:hypothetical protein
MRDVFFPLLTRACLPWHQAWDRNTDKGTPRIPPEAGRSESSLYLTAEAVTHKEWVYANAKLCEAGPCLPAGKLRPAGSPGTRMTTLFGSSLFRARFGWDLAGGAIVGDQQAVMFAHVLHVTDPVIEMLENACVAFFLD